MMLNFIFVHGTGVRQPSYDQTLAIITKQVQQKDSSARCHPCYWGGAWDSRLNAGGVSIPSETTSSRGLESLDGEDYTIRLWNLLYQDPLFELEVLASQVSKSAYVPREIPTGEILDDKLRTFIPSDGLQVQLTEAGIKPEIFAEARQSILKEPTYPKAINTASPSNIGDYQEAIAKALVAQSAILLSQQYGPQALCLTGESRDAIVKQIYFELGGATERGVLDDTKKLVEGMFSKLLTGTTKMPLNMLTTLGVRTRDNWSEDYAANAGDVIMYQARGQDIRTFIRQTVDSIQSNGSKIVLLAHSLGGIAAVDLLLEANPPKVDYLITVGSQSPILYEWNALVGMTFKQGAQLPNFPKWLNIYDQRDFLSYVGEPLFPGQVEDIEVSNQQPFPASHCAYWNNPQVWTAIFNWIPRA